MTSCRLLPRAGPDQEKQQGPSRAVPVTNQGGGKRERRACIPEKGIRGQACYPVRFSLKKIIPPARAEARNRAGWSRCTEKNNIRLTPFPKMLRRESVV